MESNLHNLVVFIKDEAELQQAREILIANGQQIEEWAFYVGGVNDFIYHTCSKNKWSMASQHDGDKEDIIITLTELEQKLKEKQS